MRVKTGDITLFWHCEECDFNTEQPLWDTAEVGPATCEKCGQEMTLEDEVLIKEKKT